MRSFCTINGCAKPEKARGLCNMHYQRVWRNGVPGLLGLKPVKERIQAKIRKTESGCWLWTGKPNQDGYGHIHINGKSVGAHRAAWEVYRGPIPDGMQLDHINCSTLCVNPDHLRLATNSQNQQNLRGAYRNNVTGIRGVYRKGNGYVAHAQLDGRRYYLGLYPTALEAGAVVADWRRKHMPYSERDRISAA